MTLGFPQSNIQFEPFSIITLHFYFDYFLISGVLSFSTFSDDITSCLQDLSRLAQKIDRLEHLLSDNNRLVATLRDSLLHPKGDNRGGANVSSAHIPADPLPGCRLADETKGGADEVQVSLADANRCFVVKSGLSFFTFFTF